MPDTIINRSDAALAYSASGAIPVSRGPSAMPLYDSRFSWDSTNLKHTIKGQSFGSGGDRLSIETSLGLGLWKIDSNGSIVNDLSVNTSNILNKIIPGGNAPPIQWYSISANTPNTGGNPYDNPVKSEGWNVGPGGNAVNTAYPTFRIGMEGNYWVPQTGEQVMEGHLFASVMPTQPVELRPHSVYIDKPNASNVIHYLQGATYNWWSAYLNQSLMYLNRSNSTGNVVWRVESDNSLSGYPLQLASVNNPSVSDALTLGRNTSNNTQYTMVGAGSSRMDMKAINGGVTQSSTFINDGSNFSLIGPGSGGGIWFRTYGYHSIANGNGSVLYSQIDPNGGTSFGRGGAAPNVGFFGASWGDGIKIMFVGDCVTAPTTNPVGGFFVWSDSVGLKAKGPNGTVTTLALR